MERYAERRAVGAAARGSQADRPALGRRLSRESAGRGGVTIDALYELVPKACPNPLLVELSPLSPSDAQSLAYDLLPSDAASEELARDIAQEAEGSPLFIAELAHQTQSAPSTPSEHAWRSLTQLVRNRVALLPADARGLLETAALAECRSPRSTARRSRGLTPNREEEVIDLLRAQHLIRTYATFQGRNIDLYHDRIRRDRAPRRAERDQDRAPLVAGTSAGSGRRSQARGRGRALLLGRPSQRGRHVLAQSRRRPPAFEALAFGHAAEL